MNDKPSIPALVEAARLLNVDLLWDPDVYPDGPGEDERPQLVAALALAMENQRSAEYRPDTIAVMRVIHGRGLADDVEQLITHATTVLSFHADVLAGFSSLEGVIEDARALIRIAVSMLATGLAEIPYQRVDMPALMVPCTTPGCPCGGTGGH